MVEWIGLAQGQVESSCEGFNEPSGSIKCFVILSSCYTTGGLLSSAHLHRFS
jgi:hypothetical protein